MRFSVVQSPKLFVVRCSGAAASLLLSALALSFVPSPARAAAASGSPIQMQVTPMSFPAGQSEKIKVTAKVPTARTAVTLLLQRLNPDGSIAQLGQLHDDGMNGDAVGGDGAYTLVVTFNERSAGEISLRIAGQPAANPGAPVLMASRQVYSAVTKLTVTQAQSSGGDLGAVIGGLLGGLLSGKDSGKDKGQNSGANSQDVPLQAKGLSLRYPPDWIFDAETLKLNGPINLRNFKSYEPAGQMGNGGGIVPPGGAEIDITRVPLGTRAPGDVLQTDLGSEVAVRTRDSYAVGGHDGVRAVYREEFSPALAYDNAAVYVPNGDQLYKFFISYRANDPQAKQFLASFERILRSVQFTP